MYKKQANMLQNNNAAEVLTELALDRNGAFRASSNKGYVIAPQKILRCFRLSEAEKVLLFELTSMMGERGYAFYGHTYLSFLSGKKSTTTIKNNLNSLRDKKFIGWAQGGGDLGTNHYEIRDLNRNAYLIMSEAVHYFVERVRRAFRNTMPYEKVYGSIMEVVELPKNKQNLNSDIYGRFITHLTKCPYERECHLLYANFFAYLFQIYSENGYTLDANWQLSFQHKFMKEFYGSKVDEPRCSFDFRMEFKQVEYEGFLFPVVDPYDVFSGQETPYSNDNGNLSGFDGWTEEDFHAFEADPDYIEEFIRNLSIERFIEECRKHNVPFTLNDVNVLKGMEGEAASFVYDSLLKTLIYKALNP